MLLTEKMQEENVSPSEKTIIDYMFEEKENIKNKTVKQIAKLTYTHPSTLIRLGKKLGYSGWIDFRDAFLEEIDYLNSYFNNIDANLPYEERDSVMTIANKMALLNQLSISETLSLINQDDLQKAITLLNNATNIKIFGLNNNLLLCHDFKAKMNRIGRKVDLATIEPEYEVASCNSETVAIAISYSGYNKRVINLLPMLKERNIPIIALTSVGENALSKSADCTLRITTRERLYSKIASFSVNDSICFLLDILYACIFAEDYQRNINYIIDISKSFDPRIGSNKVMKEKN